MRLGTPSATTRGMKEPEMERVAAWIVELCRGTGDLQAVREEVRTLCLAHPSASGLVERAEG